MHCWVLYHLNKLNFSLLIQLLTFALNPEGKHQSQSKKNDKKKLLHFVMLKSFSSAGYRVLVINRKCVIQGAKKNTR